MKTAFLITLFVLLLADVCGSRIVKAATAEPPHILARDGLALYQIALADDAIPAEQNAAEQLRRYLHEVTGASFAVRRESTIAEKAPQILVGAGKRVRRLLPEQNWTALGHDGIVISTRGKSLILAGGRPRGTLYAVFQFLEDSVGCRWWTPSASTIPTRRTLSVPSLDVRYVPPFSYRETFSTGALAKDPHFTTTLRENGHYQTQPPQWGGNYNILGFVHTFDQFLPPEKYFKAHPEWYSDPQNGNKPSTANSAMPAPQQSQLCVTNPEVIAEMTRQALARVREHPDAGYISISENDNLNYCRCERCTRLAESEGSQAGPMLLLVNAVAAKIHEVNPGFLVETLAYHGTEKPPRMVRPAANVIIRLAPIDADFGEPLDSEANRSVRDNLLQWEKISHHLFVWNYVTNFVYSIMPHPNWDTLAMDLRFMAKHKVKGVFEQGNAYTNDVGDFNPLRTWLLGRLMWNPELDQERLISEFLQGYYGAAAPHLREYLRIVLDAYRRQNQVLSCFNEDFTFLTLDTMNAATRAMDNAADAVKENEALSERVRRERLSLDLAWIYRYNALKPRSSQVEFLGPADPVAAIEVFRKHALRFGIEKTGEVPTLESLLETLKTWASSPVPLPEFARAYPDSDVVDIQQQEMSSFPSLAAIERDDAASDGETMRMSTDKYEWSVHARMNRLLPSQGKWHIYAMMRADTREGAAPTGDAFEGGIYDAAGKSFAATFPAAKSVDIAGAAYQRVNLGVHNLHSGMYLWFAPAHDSNVARLYIDRILLIREP